MNATVTICHSRTRDIETVCKDADILAVPVGIPEMVKSSWISDGAVIIDLELTGLKEKKKFLWVTLITMNA